MKGPFSSLYYLGEVHTDDRPSSDYDLSLYRTQDGINVGVDAKLMGNEARFINDYRGVRDKPNAAFEDDRSANGELRMSVWSKHLPIQKGDEILVSYGKSWWQERQEGAHDSTIDASVVLSKASITSSLKSSSGHETIGDPQPMRFCE
jgi:SET domain-containing protein